MEDFHLKQWRCHHHHHYQQQQQQHPESDSDLLQHPTTPSSSSSAATAVVAKLSILQEEEEEEEENDNTTNKQTLSSSALHLFVPEITTATNNKSIQLFPPTSTYLKMGSYFSLAQWQELELQALIYKHMLAGSSIPPELLHLLKKTILTSNSPHPPYYLPPASFQQYSHYHSALLQSGHWGRAAMDPEPGRCRRTDGKKWRCSKDVVAGHKYCDRHMHRGRNRSRKPVELPQPPAAAAFGAAGGSGGGVTVFSGNVLRANSSSNHISAVPQPFAATMIDCGTGGHFDLSPPTHLLHLNHRPLDVDREKNKSIFGMQNEVSRDSKQGGERVLRHFFDDWPRPLQELPNAAIDTGSGSGSGSDSGRSSTSLSISTPASDFSLKLSTGNEENTGSNRIQLNWASGWGANPMSGGPLAEALRSSLASDSSPTSVLHHLPRNSTSETSYVSN